MGDLVGALLVGAAALWGAVAGALLPRAAYRFSVPAEQDWRAACPDGHPLDGWLGPGRCAGCAAVAGDAGGTAVRTKRPEPYGPGALGLSLATALVCAALAAATGTRPELAVWLLIAPVGVLLAAVDFRVQRLPDVLTLPLAGFALTLLGAVAFVPEHAGDWPHALYGAIALGAGFFALFLLNPGGMGFGDVKLALGLGAVLGWYGWATVMLGALAAFLLGALYGGALVVLAAFLLGALYGGALVVARRAGRKTAIAFGPFLIGGAFLGLLVGAYAA